jgi:hypothetical protein
LATTFTLSLLLPSPCFGCRRLAFAPCLLAKVLEARVDDRDDSLFPDWVTIDFPSPLFLLLNLSLVEVSFVCDRVLLEAGCKFLVKTERASLSSVYFFFKAWTDAGNFFSGFEFKSSFLGDVVFLTADAKALVFEVVDVLLALFLTPQTVVCRRTASKTDADCLLEFVFC